MYKETIEKIKEECRIRNHSDLSCKQYVYHVSCFLKWIGDKPLDELTLADARDYIIFKRNTTCSPATCNGINSALSFFYRIILRKAWVYEEVPWTSPQGKSAESPEERTMGEATMQDVMERFLPTIADRSFSREQLNAIRCIRNCRTAEMGAHVSECESCHSTFIYYNSCKNRHCPMCQGMDVDEWIDLRREDVLEAPYFHVVFTIPSQLYSLTYANQRYLYDALYHAANRTLTELSTDPKRFGAKIGFICVLHTWGSKLNYHPHLHVIVLGGGLDRMNHWKDKGRRFFLPVKVMSAVFKKHYLAELKELRKNGDLNYAGKCETLRNGHAFKELLDRLYGMDWIAYSKKTFAGAREVFKYLGKYTHRIAISNRRIISVGEKDVTFYAKDYCADGKYKPFTLSGEAFLSRFLLHVLPSGFVKIRYYGLLACRCKKEKVALCRKLLGCREYQSELRGKTAAEKIKILFGRDVSKCSRCGEKLNTFVVSGHYMLC